MSPHESGTVTLASRIFWPFALLVLPPRASASLSLMLPPLVLSTDWSAVSANRGAVVMWLRLHSHWALKRNISALHFGVCLSYFTLKPVKLFRIHIPEYKKSLRYCCLVYFTAFLVAVFYLEVLAQKNLPEIRRAGCRLWMKWKIS